MFKEELEDLKNRYLTRLVLHHVFSREPTDAPLNSGRMDRDEDRRVPGRPGRPAHASTMPSSAARTR